MGKFEESIAEAVRLTMQDPIFLARVMYKSSGRIFWAKKTTAADYETWAAEHPAYEDGVASHYDTIQGAVDACRTALDDVDEEWQVSDGDVVIVCTGRWGENILVKDKARITITGGHGAAKQTWLRASTATTKLPFTPVGESAVLGCCIAVMSTCVEISNLTLDASGNYVGVYLGDGNRIDSDYNQDANGCYIHDCFFKYGTWGMCLDGASEDHIIEKNIIYRQSSGGIHIAPGGKRTCQRIHIRDNEFMACEGYGVYLYDANTTIHVLVLRNLFMDRADGTAMTLPIQFQGTGCHVAAGNWGPVKNSFGTDAMGSSTDFLSGNFGASAGNAHECVDET